ncbi:T9SS type A sorting domain-containing protein [Chitinophagaceae bacterium MMS25-I14]
MKKISCTAVLLLAMTTAPRAQSIGPSTLNSTGGSAVLGGNTYEWSVAEMTLVSTETGTGIIVTQGVLQPNLSSTGVHGINPLASNLLIFPNPAQNEVFLQPSFSAGDKLMYGLYDVTGKTIYRNEVVLTTGKDLQTIYLNTVAAGTYMLQVTLNRKDASVYNAGYKIQKLN